MDVTVLVMTYNHAPYIRQALDSALAQRFDGTMEILVSEDCSTDGTREIVQEYAERRPDLLRLLLSERNLRSNEVVARGFRAARGRYLALLDGDDFWTDPEKLQLQADLLDSEPGVALCFHNVEVVGPDTGSERSFWNRADQPARATLQDLLAGNFLATSSVMYRRGLVEALPGWYEDFFPVTDWPLHVFYAEHGEIAYLDCALGAYRLHEGGWFSGRSEQEKLRLNADFYRRMRAGSGGRLRRELGRAQREYFLGLFAGRCDMAYVEDRLRVVVDAVRAHGRLPKRW